MKENKVVLLSEKTHVLKRSARYLGSIVPVKISRPLIQDGKIVFGEVDYVPALLKIAREFIDNKIDENIRTGGKFANVIDIQLDHEKLVASDNGRGIPVIKSVDESGQELEQTMPELAWANLRAGSNFDDEADNTSIGQNGEGASLGVMFSSKFIGETDDLNKHFKMVCTDNISTKDVKITPSKKKNGTKIQFYPDMDKLNLGDKIDPIYQDLLYFDLLFLSITYPDITFKFNKRVIKIKSYNQLIKEYFDSKIICTEQDNVIIGVTSSEIGYNFIQFVNGINAYNGGNTLDYIEKRVVLPLTERFQKSLKTIKAADIKNKISIHVIFKDMVNPRFEDQLKTSCINTASQFPEIAEQILEISKSKFIEKIYKEKSISDPIRDLHKANELVALGKDAKNAQKKVKVSAKYWKASKVKKRLFLAEGDSAINPIIAEIGREENGFFPLKGKLINCLKKSLKLVLKNDEVIQLADILGINLSHNENGKDKDLDYLEIWLAGDMDVDGSHVVLLVLSFIEKFAPAYLDKVRVFRFMSPVMIALKNDIPINMFFTMKEFADFRDNKNTRGISWYYAKGLGSLSEEMWEFLFKEFPLKDLGLPLSFDNVDDPEKERQEMYSWLTDDIDFRKVKIKENIANFDLGDS